VRLDPRVRVASGDLEAQLRLSQAIDSTLQRAWAAHDAITGARSTRGSALDPALRDSLAALAGPGPASLSAVADQLTQLAISAQSADSAPSQGLEEAFRACEARTTGLISRWHGLETSLPPPGVTGRRRDHGSAGRQARARTRARPAAARRRLRSRR
jgi:hypothetical protein